MTTANDKAWDSILSHDPSILQSIESQGFFDIESMQIKRYREPRLACKIDFREEVPIPLKTKKLSVLAIRNGLYRIAQTDTFIDVPQEDGLQSRPIQFSIPKHIKVLSPTAISGESKALDAALLSGMLDHVFKDQVSLVLRGRERSEKFRFAMSDRVKCGSVIPYEVDGVQIEVDGGYEGRKGIYLVEAKNVVNANMNIRQLIYPAIHYQRKFGEAKPVHTYLLLFDTTTEIFHFTRFQATHGDGFAKPFELKPFELKPLESIACRLEIPNEPIRDYWKALRTIPVDESVVDTTRPFPQADDFRKVFDMYQRLKDEGELGVTELFGNYAITPRQFGYYGNAMRWLGIVDFDRSKQTYVLSNQGRKLALIESKKEALFEMAKIAMTNDIFHEFYHYGRAGVSSKSRYRNRLHTDSTFWRRLGTVDSWLAYFQTVLAPTL